MNHLTTVSTPHAPVSSFRNGQLNECVRWLDTDGNLINAHDGGILFHEGRYYWYGMALRPASTQAGGQITTQGVVMYSSADLYNWDYEGVILPCSTEIDHPLCGPMRFERPKIIYNAATRKFVLWCHYVVRPGHHMDTPGTGEAGVASCDTINGQYSWHGTLRPIDEHGIVRDSTLFQDDDGSAYFIYDRDMGAPGPDYDRVLHVVKLSDDYLCPTDTWQKLEVATRREAPVVIKRDGFYFLVTSGLTSWRFNPAQYFRATNILGPYEDMGDPCRGELTETTFNSQGTHAFALQGQPDKFIFITERHNTECMTDSSFLFLPVFFPTADTLQLRYLPEWRLEFWPDEIAGDNV